MATPNQRLPSAEQVMKVVVKQRFLKQAQIEQKERLQAKFRRALAAAKAVHETHMMANGFQARRALQAAAKAKAAQQEEALKAAQRQAGAGRPVRMWRMQLLRQPRTWLGSSSQGYVGCGRRRTSSG